MTLPLKRNPVPPPEAPSAPPEGLSGEPHFEPQQLADQWGLSRATIVRLFYNEPGVMKINARHSSLRKRPKITLRIPASVAERVHRRLSA